MRKVFITLLTALMSLSMALAANSKAVVASTIQLSEEELAYNDGIELLKKGDYAEAITKFTLALSIDSQFTNAYYNRAIAYTGLGVYNRAMSDIDNAIRLFGVNDNADNHILKSKIHYGMGNVAKASEEIDKALELSPSNTKAMLDKAALFQATGEYELALPIYTTYNYKTGGDASSYNELGNCYYMDGDKRAALECYKKAYSADSANAAVCFNLAKGVWEFSQDTVKALSIVDKLIASDSTNAEYYNLKGYICYQAGDTLNAGVNFDLAIKNSGNMAQAYNGKGLIQLNAGNYSEAIKFFNNAISANINYGDAYVNRGITKERLEDYNGACEDFKTAVDLGAENADEYYTKQCTEK